MPGPGTWVAGDVLTAADLNAIGAWQTWSPTLTNVTLGTTGAESVHRYCQINDLVVFRSRIVLGTGGSLTGQFQMTLPVTAIGIDCITATVNLCDTGSVFYPGSVTNDTTTTLQVYAHSTTNAYDYAVYTRIAAAVPFTWVATDRIVISGVYQAA